MFERSDKSKQSEKVLDFHRTDLDDNLTFEAEPGVDICALPGALYKRSRLLKR